MRTLSFEKIGNKLAAKYDNESESFLHLLFAIVN